MQATVAYAMHIIVTARDNSVKITSQDCPSTLSSRLILLNYIPLLSYTSLISFVFFREKLDDTVCLLVTLVNKNRAAIKEGQSWATVRAAACKEGAKHIRQHRLCSAKRNVSRAIDYILRTVLCGAFLRWYRR